MTTASVSDRARELHDRSPVILAHDHTADLDSLLKMREAGVDAKACYVQVDALVWDEEGTDSSLRSYYSYEGWARRGLRSIERVLRIVDSHPQRFLLVRRASDILEAQRTGRAGLILGFEGARPLEGTIELLSIYHRLGLRQLQLTMPHGNELCDRVAPPPGELTWANARAVFGTRTPGLTDFGREVIREANRLGIVIDPDHAREQTVFEVLELSAQPIVFSHSACLGAGKNIKYGATDAQLRALAANGGVTCIHFWDEVLCGRDATATVDDIVDHVLYAATVAGIDHVGLGPDYVPLTPDYCRVHQLLIGRELDHIGPMKEQDDIAKLPWLTERMVERGMSDEEIRKVLGGNLLRVYRQVWGE